MVARIRDCTVCEVNIPCCLSISHAEERYGGWEHSHVLARELIALDEGVPMLIYAIIDDTPAGPVLDSVQLATLVAKDMEVSFFLDGDEFKFKGELARQPGIAGRCVIAKGRAAIQECLNVTQHPIDRL